MCAYSSVGGIVFLDVMICDLRIYVVFLCVCVYACMCEYVCVDAYLSISLCLSHDLSLYICLTLFSLECWWDQVFLDVLICNGLGIYVGRKLCDYLEFKQYSWTYVCESE